MIDHQQANRFLALLGKEPGSARLRAFLPSGHPGKASDPGRKGPYDLRQAERWQQQGRGIYLVINDGGDIDADITACRAFFLEWDNQPVPWQLSAWQHFGLGEPTVSITTGGKSAHLYWVLTEPISPARWAPIQSALIAITGADSTIRNPSRVMRLPGGQYIGSDGSAQGVTTIYAETTHRYSADEIEGWLAALNEFSPIPGASHGLPQGIELVDASSSGTLPPRPPETLREALLRIPPFRHSAGQYQQLVDLAMRLHVDLGAADAQQLLAETCCSQIRDLPSYFRRAPTRLSTGSVWPFLRETWGIDISRSDLRSTAAPQRRPTAASDEPPQLTYRELLSQTLEAIRGGNEDEEMELRAQIMGRFKRSDSQINAALFSLLTKQEGGTTTANYGAIDVDKIAPSRWLIDGFVPANDQALLYGEAGAGKTTAGLELAFAIIDGAGLLDRSAPAEQGKVLFISSDSGRRPLLTLMNHAGFDNHPAVRDGRFLIWAHSPEERRLAWDASVAGCLALLEAIRRENISLVLIDSCKAVTSKAEIDYTSNTQISALLTFFQEVICQHCSVVWLNHDGTASGATAGAKAWKEIPSIVHSIEMVPVGMQEGKEDKPCRDPRMNPELRRWRVRKCRHGSSREFIYRVSVETGRLLVTGEVEIVGDCSEAVLQLLRGAHQQGPQSVGLQEITDHCLNQHGYSSKTVRNTLTKLANARTIVRSGRGRYSLSPKQQQLMGGGIHVGREDKGKDPSQGLGSPFVPALVPRDKLGTNSVPGVCPDVPAQKSLGTKANASQALGFGALSSRGGWAPQARAKPERLGGVDWMPFGQTAPPAAR